VAAAVGAAFGEHLQRIDGMSEEHAGDPTQTRTAFVDFCLSPAHREDPGHGCPSSLVTAMAHSSPGGAPRAAFVEGMRTLLRELAEKAGGKDADAGASSADRPRGPAQGR
jgi:TetR/AcrR family transcriptional regulator, transcriptional repressor for nem operon